MTTPRTCKSCPAEVAGRKQFCGACLVERARERNRTSWRAANPHAPWECVDCKASVPPRARRCPPCRKAHHAKLRRAALGDPGSEEREDSNAYARLYYRARHPLPPCQTCQQPVHHANALYCHTCCPWPTVRARSREAKQRARIKARGSP